MPKRSSITPTTEAKAEAAQNVTLKKQGMAGLEASILIRGQKSKTPAISSDLSRAQIVPLTSTPNVISGIVTSLDNQPLANIILTVKDASLIPVRAFKTNRLGQFLSITPLPSGQYSIEAESETHAFDPLMINLKGQVLEPLQIKAKTPVV